MKHTISVLICTMMLSSCELIVISSKKNQSIDISQNTPLGVVYLFKTELDSNNIPGAAQTLASPSGVKYLALEKYELYDEVARIKRMIGSSPVTRIKTDSISSSSFRFNVEFDYLRTMSFTTAKIKENWYIVSYAE